MATKLRTIAVHVEEPKPRRFEWVLSERTGAAWAELARSEAPVGTYKRAMADGLLALQALIEDLDAGPRHAGVELTEPPEARPPEDEGGTQAAAQRPGTYFGFGPAR